MIILVKIALVAMALPLLVAPAVAREGQSFIDRFDMNADGLVTQAELDTAREALFVTLDSNGDGLIGTPERDAMRDEAANADPVFRMMAGRMFDRLDTTGDGALSLEEVLAPRRSFQMADTNQDGALDADEVGQSMDFLRMRTN